MRIATFNVNSIRSRLPVVLAWLEQHRPDALCLQETKAEDHAFPAAPIEAAGYRCAFRGEKSYNGVAILSREAPDETWFGFDDGGPADAARLVGCRFGPWTLVNTYVPQGREIEHVMYRYKLEWFARLRRLFDRRLKPADRVVWVGDMNVAPTPLDVHNPREQEQHVCFHADVRAAYARTLDWGFEDVFRRHHPEPGHFSFFDYRTPNAVGRGMGWRIDHILATPPAAARCADAWIDLEPRRAEKPSDHTVVAADFSD